MEELENKVKNAKAALKHYFEMVNVNICLVSIGVIFSVIYSFVKNDATKVLLDISLGIFSTVLVMIAAICFIYRKELKAYSDARKELKSKK